MSSLREGTRSDRSSGATRSGMMIGCLRDNMLYSEKRARDYLFSAIETILSSRSAPPILARLTREASARAREAAAKSGYVFSNWEPASRAVSNAMLHAGVLLDENRMPILPGVMAQAATVVGLKEAFRDCTEAFLVEFLVGKMGDLSTRDHKALAHALFRQFDPKISMEDLEDRAVLLLARLADRISLGEDGVYSIRNNTRPSNVA